MFMGIYNLDTSILLDVYEKRNMGEELIKKIILKLIEEDAALILSDLHIMELKKLSYASEEIQSIFRIFKANNIKKVHSNKNQLIEAKQIAFKRNIPKKDVLHAILARDNEAVMIATDNHFEKLTDIVEIKKPKDLL